MDDIIQPSSSEENKSYTEYSESLRQNIGEEDLTTQLFRILAMDGILPNENEKPILGHELIRKIAPLLKPGYSENSIKNYFSQLSKDESSPIAKSAQGYGYYARKSSEEIDPTSYAIKELTDLVNETGASKRDAQAEEKFRVLYLLHMESGKKFPAYIDHTKAHRGPKGLNHWKFPDVVSLEWDTGVLTQIGNKLVLDTDFCDLREANGVSSYNLISTELKVDISLSNARKFFFQCVSNSKWANDAHLVVARKIDDAILVDDLKKLGAIHGVSIISFNFDKDMLNRFPTADKILNMKDDQREMLVEEFCSNITVIYQAKRAKSLDWERIHDLRIISPDFSRIIKWIPKCRSDKQAYTLNDFQVKDFEEYTIKHRYDKNTYRN
ncbi:MAG: hypothetical protein ACOYMG_17675 [Candidatus Methylumidiphilus sp.]